MPSQFFHAQIPHPNSSNHSAPNLSPTSPKWCSPNQQNINFVNTPCLKRKDTSSILLFIIQMYISQPFSVLLKTEIELDPNFGIEIWSNLSHGFQWIYPFTWKASFALRRNSLSLSNKVSYLDPVTLMTLLGGREGGCSHFKFIFTKVLIYQLTYYTGRHKGHSTCWVLLKSSLPLSCLYLFGPCLLLCGLVFLRVSCRSYILCYIHNANYYKPANFNLKSTYNTP